ncbi:MAG: hypothetical protein QM713_10960 [Arachnia sp.]
MLGDLLRAEFARLVYRRRATYSLVLMLALGLLLPTQWMSAFAPLSTEDYASAAENYQWCVEWSGDEPCLYADYLRTPGSFTDMISQIGSGVLFLALVVFMVVVTYVGSDFSSGALGTQLTFTPRRWAVLVARTTAAGALGAVLMAVGLVSSTVESVVWFMAMNGFDSATPAAGLLAVVGSSILYGIFIGMIGALLVFLLNGTVLAAAAGLIAVTISLWGDVYGSWEAASTTLNLWYYLGPVWQGFTLVDPSLMTNMMGLGVAHRWVGVVYHLSVIALLAVLTVPLFERRDVKG